MRQEGSRFFANARASFSCSNAEQSSEVSRKTRGVWEGERSSNAFPTVFLLHNTTAGIFIKTISRNGEWTSRGGPGYSDERQQLQKTTKLLPQSGMRHQAPFLVKRICSGKHSVEKWQLRKEVGLRIKDGVNPCPGCATHSTSTVCRGG